MTDLLNEQGIHSPTFTQLPPSDESEQIHVIHLSKDLSQ